MKKKYKMDSVLRKWRHYAGILQKGIVAAAAVFMMAMFSACEVTDHTEEALEKARKFALKEARDLTEYQRNVIRYSLPVIQGQMIFNAEPIRLTEYEHIPRNEFHKPLDTKHLDYVSSSFVWRIPDLGGEVVVYGTGDRNFRFWEPLKVMYRKLAEPDKDYIAAWKTAVSFTEDNLLYITDTERDRIRFSEAKVWCTTFDLKYLEEDKPRKIETTWTSYQLKKIGGKKEKYQVSLVWQADDPGKFIVFTGLGADIPDGDKMENKEEFSLLKNWSILTVRVIDKVKFSEFVTEFKEPVKEKKSVKSMKKSSETSEEKSSTKEKNAEEKKMLSSGGKK